MTQLDVVKKAYEMGISGIDFTDLQPNAAPTLEDQLAYAAEIRKEAEQYGVEIVSYTIESMPMPTPPNIPANNHTPLVLANHRHSTRFSAKQP